MSKRASIAKKTEKDPPVTSTTAIGDQFAGNKPRIAKAIAPAKIAIAHDGSTAAAKDLIVPPIRRSAKAPYKSEAKHKWSPTARAMPPGVLENEAPTTDAAI